MMIVTKLFYIGSLTTHNTMMATTTPYAVIANKSVQVIVYTANNSVKVSLVGFSFIKIFTAGTLIRHLPGLPDPICQLWIMSEQLCFISF